MKRKIENELSVRVPWEDIGHPLDNCSTVEEMLQAAELDWKVEMRPIHVKLSSGEYKRIPKKQALVRKSDGEILTIASDSWHPIENELVFRFLQKFTEAGGSTLAIAGSLAGGRIIWASVDLNRQIKLPNNDTIQGTLLIRHPHVWGASLSIMFSPMRLDCWNMIPYFLRNVDQNTLFNFRHNSLITDRVASLANDISKMTETQISDFERVAHVLIKAKYSRSNLDEYMRALFPHSSKDKVKLSDNAKKVIEQVETQPGAERHPGTWWNALNSVTYYTDHQAGRTRDSTLRSAWFGQRAQLKRVALELALDYAKTA